MLNENSFNKKISILIPALDEEKYILRLLTQFTDEFKSEYNAEIILSDGGSKDSTVEISKKYVDRLILNQNNFPQNISQGRNEAARNSLGDVLIFLNADTYVDNLRYLIDESLKLMEGKDISAIACRVSVYPEEIKLSDRLFHGFYNFYVYILNMLFMGMGRGECHIIKREKFFEAGGYNEDIIAGEDFDLYRRIRKHGRIKYRDDFLIYESPRRYRKFGYAKVFWDWTKNSFSVFLFNKSVSKKWEAVR